jgi:hypothetical protein
MGGGDTDRKDSKAAESVLSAVMDLGGSDDATLDDESDDDDNDDDGKEDDNDDADVDAGVNDED